MFPIENYVDKLILDVCRYIKCSFNFSINSSHKMFSPKSSVKYQESVSSCCQPTKTQLSVRLLLFNSFSRGWRNVVYKEYNLNFCHPQQQQQNWNGNCGNLVVPEEKEACLSSACPLEAARNKPQQKSCVRRQRQRQEKRLQ